MNNLTARQKLFRFLLSCVCCLFCLGSVATLSVGSAAASENTVIIEWLQFEVPQDEQALFIAKETEIWEPVNRRSPEYLGKEIWQDAKQPNRVIMLNRWSGENHKQTITPKMIQQAEATFEKAVGKNYPIIGSKTFYRLNVNEEGDRR